MNISKILEGNQNQRGIFLGYEHKNGKDIKKAITQNQPIDWDGHIDGKQMYGLSPVKFIKNGNGSKGVCRWCANDVDLEVETKEFIKNLFLAEQEAFAFTTTSGRWHTYYFFDDFIPVAEARDKAKQLEKKLVKHYGKDVDKGHSLPQGYGEATEKPGSWLFQPYATYSDLKVKPVCISLSGTPLTIEQFEFRYKWRKHLLINACVGLASPGRHKALFIAGLYLRHNPEVKLTLEEVNENFNQPISNSGPNSELDEAIAHVKDSIEKYSPEHLGKNFNNYITELTDIEIPFTPGIPMSNPRSEAEQTPETEEFFDNVVYIKKDNVFYDLRTRSEYSKDTINITYGGLFKTSKGIPIPPVKVFSISPNSKMVEVMEYRPDLWTPEADPIFKDERGILILNIFEPGGVDPIEPTLPRHFEELELFKTLVNNLVVEPDENEWLLDTLSTIFQHTGKKIRHMPVIFSPHFQIGKSTLFKTIRKGLGDKNCAIIGPKQAIDREKAFLADKMLVLVDELKLDSDHKKNVATLNILKPFSTEDRHDVRPLFKGWREVFSTCNFIIYTNHKDAIAVPKNEARYTIIKASKTRDEMGGDKFYDEYWNAYKTGTIAGVVKHYLLNRKISSNFRVEGPSLITPALLEMSEQAGHPLFYDVQLAFNSKDQPFEREIFSVSDAWDYLKQTKGLRGKLNDFVDVVVELGCKKIGECKHKVSGKHPILYACRHFEFFHGKSNSEIANKYFLPLDITDEAIKGNKYKLSTTDIQMIKDNLMEVKAYEEFHEDTQEENKEVFKS
jgi:hypothetical protein|tara:strand:+ start:904 stop:3264 length:2361 start_codon:yes stop_codon:yes gene_type:complete